MSRTHELKTDPKVFEAVWRGVKTFEIRKNDRGFQVGDELLLRETEWSGTAMFEGAPLVYTGRTISKIVSHVLTGYGLDNLWCCLSFATPAPAQPEGQEDEPVAWVTPMDMRRLKDGRTSFVRPMSEQAKNRTLLYLHPSRSAGAAAPAEVAMLRALLAEVIDDEDEAAHTLGTDLLSRIKTAIAAPKEKP